MLDLVESVLKLKHVILIKAHSGRCKRKQDPEPGCSGVGNLWDIHLRLLVSLSFSFPFHSG